MNEIFNIPTGPPEEQVLHSTAMQPRNPRESGSIRELGQSEAGGGGDNYQADLSGCGGVDNGFGGYNRTFTVTGTAMTLTTYEFNSCTESAIASTENVSTLGGLMVAPNPATDQVTISFNNDSNTEHTVSLFALTGQLLQQVQLGTDRSVTIDVAKLPTGMYLLQFTNELGERGTQKLMVK